jgi:hypothetical protein
MAAKRGALKLGVPRFPFLPFGQAMGGSCHNGVDPVRAGHAAVRL